MGCKPETLFFLFNKFICQDILPFFFSPATSKEKTKDYSKPKYRYTLTIIKSDLEEMFY